MQENNEANVNNCKDLERLLDGLKNFGLGKFDSLNPEDFDDPNVAMVFNEFLDNNMKRGNHYLARINDAQSRIGDVSTLKTMLEEIYQQQIVLNSLQESRESMHFDESVAKDKNDEFLALTHQVGNSLSPCIKEIEESLEDISVVEDYFAVKSVSREVSDSISAVRKKLSLSIQRLEGMSNRIDTITDDASVLFDEIDIESRISTQFLNNVDKLTDGYRKLSGDCIDMGRYITRISRDIDNARNDMFRHNSKPTLLDTLKVFEVDHITLAWRLYNNIVEFESLRLTQVNNSTTCKLGLWLEGITDQQIRESEGYKQLYSAHKELHVIATECFEAKQVYNDELAREKFDCLIEKLEEFKLAMRELHDFLKSIGIEEETDVWKFQP